jgi:capsular exopolysaccharide synthesis family protein
MSRLYEALKKADRLSRMSEEGAEQSPTPETGYLPSANQVSFKTTNFPAESPSSEQEVSHSEELRGSDESSYEDGPFLPTALYNNRAKAKPCLAVGHPALLGTAEQFHLLSLSVQRWAKEGEKHILTIVSAVGGEGKSFVALNLGASLAMHGCKVVLVDADLRQPALHEALEVRSKNGLYNYLKGEVGFYDCLQPTLLPGLFLVAAGGTSNAPAQLLAGPQMRNFIREGRSMTPFHYIIVDSPASLSAPEPEILSHLADASLVVVAADRTPRALVKQTLEMVPRSKVLGFVLNRFTPMFSASPHYPTPLKEA